MSFSQPAFDTKLHKKKFIQQLTQATTSQNTTKLGQLDQDTILHKKKFIQQLEKARQTQSSHDSEHE